MLAGQTCSCIFTCITCFYWPLFRQYGSRNLTKEWFTIFLLVLDVQIWPFDTCSDDSRGITDEAVQLCLCSTYPWVDDIKSNVSKVRALFLGNTSKWFSSAKPQINIVDSIWKGTLYYDKLSAAFAHDCLHFVITPQSPQSQWATQVLKN